MEQTGGSPAKLGRYSTLDGTHGIAEIAVVPCDGDFATERMVAAIYLAALLALAYRVGRFWDVPVRAVADRWRKRAVV